MCWNIDDHADVIGVPRYIGDRSGVRISATVAYPNHSIGIEECDRREILEYRRGSVGEGKKAVLRWGGCRVADRSDVSLKCERARLR